jgi:hypothetical protein
MAEENSDFVAVYRGFDPVRAGMLVSGLQAEGIVCRHLGTQHPAQIGIGEMICEQIIEVPVEDGDRARELLDAWEAA